MAEVFHCGGFNRRSGLLQSSNIRFESQAILDEIISCSPPLSQQSGVICSHRFSIPFSSLQGLSHGTSVPRHPRLPCWHTLGFRSCKPHLGHPVTRTPIWNHESASSHRVKFQSSQTPSSTLSTATVKQGETSLTWGKFLVHNVTSVCRHASAHAWY